VYIGCARNAQDIESALLLAARCFQVEKKTVAIRSLYEKIFERNVIILINESGDLCGTCFLVDRIFYRGKNRLKGTFLTYICIAEQSRGKGLSTILMNGAIEECERRDSVFAIVIARRAVDHFYNRFHFWGLSQYSEIKIKFADIDSCIRHYTIAPATPADLDEVNHLYEASYANLYGACVRTIQYWNHLLWKAKQHSYQFVVYKIQDKIQGYAIFSGAHLYEFATTKTISSLEILYDFSQLYAFKELILSCPKEHPLVTKLQGVDFTIIQRQCSYGGHMVRVINKNKLIKCLAQEIQDKLNHFGIDKYKEQCGENIVELQKEQINIRIADPPYHYEDTCFLMGADFLSHGLNQNSIYQPHAFNIPLMDQM
jgi:predicted acetyltransferase